MENKEQLCGVSQHLELFVVSHSLGVLCLRHKKPVFKIPSRIILKQQKLKPKLHSWLGDGLPGDAAMMSQTLMEKHP